jgi:hypothetical protein
MQQRSILFSFCTPEKQHVLGDSCGNTWIYGGYHDFSNGVFMNDLWAFSPSSLNWVMTDGGVVGNQPPNFGIMGVSSPTNDPGGRMGCPYWTDADGNFWLYGGWGLNSFNLC